MADTTSSLSLSPSSSSATPTGTRDSAPGSPNNNNNNEGPGNMMGGMASYYIVFLMLAVCVIGIVVFLNFRRRRKRQMQLLHGRGDSYQQDYAGARRYWPRGWGDANVSREEGLNEHGEAPPPYVPKSAQAQEQGPAVPLQALSRDEAGFRPPAYNEAGPSQNHSSETRQGQ